jgi:aspartate racemase
LVRTIGLLGGMSWESSIEYERMINEGVRERLGGVHSADLIIRSYDFARIEALQAAGDWSAAGDLLAADAVHLQNAGADIIVLCTNTMHIVADHITAAVDVEFIHLADATATAVVDASLDRIGLLGTRYTMEAEFYRGRLEAGGLEVIVPHEPDRTRVHDVIYDELVQGIVSPSSRAEFVAIIDRMVADGALGIIAGCTEIELLIGPGDIDVPLFPTTRIHAEAAIRASLE